MDSFSYKAYLPNQKIETGKINASDQADAARQLAAQKKKVFSIEKATKNENSNRFFKLDRNPDLARFFEDLCELLNAGLNVDVALRVMAESETNRTHRFFYDKLLLELTEGRSLSEACAPHNFIPPDSIALVKAGEQSGQLNEVLKIITTDLKRSIERRRELFEMLAYPIFLIVVMLLAIAAIANFLVPAIKPLFESSGQELPLILSLFQILENVMKEEQP